MTHQSLTTALAALIPDAALRWHDLPGAGGLRGLFLDEEAALRPLPPDQAEAVMHDPPFWALLWPSGERLCRLFSAWPEAVRGRSVLDFGCGGGLVAAAAAKAGAVTAWAVDIDPLARQATLANAAGNDVELQVGEEAPEDRVDLLLLADFLYDQSHLPLFDRLRARASEVLVVDSRLVALQRDGFVFLGESRGQAVPDLDPHREFGLLRFWYQGPRETEWRDALALSGAVAQGFSEC